MQVVPDVVELPMPLRSVKTFVPITVCLSEINMALREVTGQRRVVC